MIFRVLKPILFSRNHLTCSSLVGISKYRNFCKSNDNINKNSKKNAKNEKKPVKEPSDRKSTADRLNKLLSSMSSEENITLQKDVEIRKPKRFNKKNAKDESSESDKDEKKPKNIVEAAKKVAETIKGDSKQTEIELLSKLLGMPIDKGGKSNLSDIISGMEVTKEDKADTLRGATRADFVRRTVNRQEQTGDSPSRERYSRKPRNIEASTTPVTSVNLFGAEPLGIFSESIGSSTEFLKTWDYLKKRELRLAVTHPPSNYFEKMALWTKQGNIWCFPIDNEQDIGEEAAVDFTEHVFLEEKLEPWCPEKGPVRHFMELVVIGLSKNPYLSIQDKHEHIEYYKNYFESKKDLLAQIIVESKIEKPKEI